MCHDAPGGVFRVFQELIDEQQKLLKKIPEDKWTTTVREAFNKDSVTVRMERRLFKKGDNPNVDFLALKDKSSQMVPIEGYPYAGIIGKKLKKGPTDWTDIGNQVVSDYQREREDEFVAELRKRYPVEIHEDVLKTVKSISTDNNTSEKKE